MFGQYASFIIPAYAVSALVIAGLVIWIRLQHRARRQELVRLEDSGLVRRSNQKNSQ